MQTLKEKNNRAGLIGTIIFHALLLLLFLFVGMTYPDPPPPEEGITINFGNSEDGMGDNQSEELSESENESNEAMNNSQSSSTPAEQQIQTQNTTQTVNVNASTTTTTQTTNTTQNSTSQNLSEALNSFNNSGGASGNEGETGNIGNQGSLEGDVNSNNYTGGGVGNGVTYSLSGRSLLSMPKIEDNSQEQGKVVVDIVVDKYGKVIKATPGGRGSTTTSPILYKKAVEAALKTKFNAKAELVSDQKGQMTFVFILN